MHVLQEEIRAYLTDCAERFGVIPYIRFGHELLGAQWDEEGRRWRLETARGTVTADVVVGGMGGLSNLGGWMSYDSPLCVSHPGSGNGPQLVLWSGGRMRPPPGAACGAGGSAHAPIRNSH